MSPQLWLEGMLENYNAASTAVRDIFDTDMTLYEMLFLQILGIDLTVSIIITSVSFFSLLLRYYE